MVVPFRKLLRRGAIFCALPFAAHAWDPGVIDPVNPPPGVHVIYRDAAPAPAPRVAPMPRPARAVSYAAAPAPAALPPPSPVPHAIVYAPASAPAPYMPPPAPPAAAAVYYPASPPPSAPYYIPPPSYAPSPYATTAAPAKPVGTASYATADFAHNESSVGLQGFWDQYREPGGLLESNAGYGAIDGDFAHYFDNRIFARIDGRASYGINDYSSISGTTSGVDQWEFESRLTGGYSFALGGGRLEPYIGFGTRYFMDDGKGTVTSFGAGGYDRRILQFYMPVGTSYRFTSGGWSFRPTLEYDPLLLGKVKSDLAQVNPATYDNITNRQDPFRGFGLRAEFLMGPADPEPFGWNWEFGPFLRYWNFQQSKVTTDSHGVPWVEPQNTRLQIGAEAKLLF